MGHQSTWIFDDPLAHMTLFEKLKHGSPDTILYRADDQEQWKYRNDDEGEGFNFNICKFLHKILFKKTIHFNSNICDNFIK